MKNRTTRRTFLGSTLAAGTLLATGLPGGSAAKGETAPSAAPTTAPKPLSILILGGTGFIGPNQVRYAVQRGHKVTIFNRGKTNPGLFPDVEHLEGDRNGKLEALKGREWDAVIDNPATLPRWVRDAAQLLKDSAGQYLFISTLSVYADDSKPGMDETDRTIVLEDPNVETVTGETYGGLKALAEKEAERAFPGRATIVRPGLIVGPGDLSDRFTYWPVRIDAGGEVLAPGNPTDLVQFIDARDIGEWTVRLVEQRAFGTFNAMGPEAPLSMAEMLYGIRAVTSAPVSFTWVPADFLESQGVQPWSDMPVWLPPAGAYAGFSSRSNRRAIEKGLTFRPLADTARATLDWYETRSAEAKAKPRAGLPRAREAEVLAAWKKKRAS
jgi:2'-hydroxyisoflavone reductase